MAENDQEKLLSNASSDNNGRAGAGPPANSVSNNSWLWKFNDGMEKAFQATAATVASVATEVRQGAQEFWRDSTAVPTTILCKACDVGINVPPSAFDWVCQAGHVNSMKNSACQSPGCQREKPKDSKPSVICGNCQVMNVVPPSNVRNDLRNLGLVTSRGVSSAGSFTKSKVQEMKQPPNQFECSHCMGFCQAANKEDKTVLCPTCGRQTPVPANVLLHGLSAGAKGAGSFLTKVFWDVVDEPYIVCQRCATHTLLRDLKAKGDLPENKQEAKQGEQPTLTCPVCCEPVELGDEYIQQRSKTGFAVLKNTQRPPRRASAAGPTTPLPPPTPTAAPLAVPPAAPDGSDPAPMDGEVVAATKEAEIKEGPQDEL